MKLCSRVHVASSETHQTLNPTFPGLTPAVGGFFFCLLNFSHFFKTVVRNEFIAIKKQ